MIYKFCVILSKPKRVDMYLSTLFKDFSRSYIQKLIDRKQIKVNGEFFSKNLKIKNKDEVYIEIIIDNLEINPEKMNLDIIFEDSNILILNKKPNINVHTVPWEWWNKNTLVNWLLYHCKLSLWSIWGVKRPWIVHRLDKDTSGLIMIAKNDSMMKYLSYIIKNREINKYYIAIVYWKVKDRKFKIESLIWRHKDDRTKMTTLRPINPKLAITNWELIDYIDNKYSILKIKLETGRTHQIRVHLSSIWYPIIWDKVYWNSKVNKEVATIFELKRQALHAYKLNFELYWKKVEFIAPLLKDMRKVIWIINTNF